MTRSLFAALWLAGYTLGTLALILAPALIEGRSPERNAALGAYEGDK